MAAAAVTPSRPVGGALISQGRWSGNARLQDPWGGNQGRAVPAHRQRCHGHRLGSQGVSGSSTATLSSCRTITTAPLNLIAVRFIRVWSLRVGAKRQPSEPPEAALGSDVMRTVARSVGGGQPRGRQRDHQQEPGTLEELGRGQRLPDQRGTAHAQELSAGAQLTTETRLFSGGGHWRH